MQSAAFIARRAAGLALLFLGVAAGSACSTTPSVAHVRARLVQVDVYDRVDGTALPVYAKDGRHYIVGTPGHEYAVRIRNCTSNRVLVVTSVDGVNVISGETAAASQAGYVLDPWGSVEIKGWRKNLQRTAAFYFTEHANSYAARTGRPDNVGVIGVAVFRERVQPIGLQQRHSPRGRIAAEPYSPPPGPHGAGAADTNEAAPAASPSESDASSEPGRQEASTEAAKVQRPLGTGHGRNESSRATVVRFERASEAPADMVAVQYDRRENLIAIGVLPPSARIARREPQPFPGTLRFTPDP